VRYLVEAGTDAASLLLFDPGALPEDFDVRAQRDGLEIFDGLWERGVACYLSTGADGAYLLHAYVNEPVPESLQPYLREPMTVESFAVPTGQVYFTGAEYGFRNDDSLLKRYPHMGGSMSLAPGAYRLDIWRTEYPDRMQESLLREQVPPMGYALHQGMGWFVFAAVVGAIGLIATTAQGILNVWFWYLLPLWLLMVGLPFIVSRTQIYREARDKFREIEREYPSVVARMNFMEQLDADGR
jgi:hypothetical protein